ncbi:MAG: hypothetical protein JF593_01970 [Novosphingobium sp.]|nr:hypothetical protein [Novosphingobium sp.]
MDAPLYPPAAAFEAPVRVPHALSTRSSSIAELADDPEARAIVEREMPGTFAGMNGPMAAQAEEMSFRSLVQFGYAKSEVLERVDAGLARLNARRGVRL